MSYTDNSLREGIAAVKAGQHAKARALLQKVIGQRPYNIDAQLWLGGAVETDDEKRACLINVLVISPVNLHAWAGLRHLGSGVFTNWLEESVAAYEETVAKLENLVGIT